MASTYLTRTIGSGSNGTTFTISFWLKISSTSANHTIVGLSSDSNSTKYVEVALKSNHKLDIQFRNGTSGNNGTYLRRRTNRLFRDVNAWYHIVLRVDSTQASASDRIRIYVNGVQETSIDVDSTPDMPQNYVTDFNNNNSVFRIGRGAGSSSYYLDGLLSHFHFADGQSLAPTVFGETDSTTGEWKIIASPTFTVGTEGFTILKDGNTITDQSSNSNNFTLGGGTLTKTEDCPSNVFATLNPLINTTTYNGSKLSNGNNTAASSTNYKGTIWSTLGASTGKWYWEAKAGDGGNGFGIVNDEIDNNVWSLGSTGNYVIWNNNGNIERPSGSTASGTTFALNDIIGVAWNATDGEVTFYKNGTAINSGTAYSVEGTQGTMFASVSDTSTGGNPTAHLNFGNGYFGTTAVSSAGTNASGIGIFEYDVPTGYTALSTKGLNE